MKCREFYLAFCVFFLLTVTFCFESPLFAQSSNYKQIAMYGSTLPGSWENENYSAIISLLYINWDFLEESMKLEAIEDCRSRHCAWPMGELVKSGDRYRMDIGSAEAERWLIISPINVNRLHVRVFTRFRDSNYLSSWEYYFTRAGGSSRGNSNK